MPSQQRRWRDHESAPARARHEPNRRGQEHAVDRLSLGHDWFAAVRC
jgi:hypothetical protein